MSEALSVLRKFKSSMIVTDPFPYFVIENALPTEIYEKLSAGYPSSEMILKHMIRRRQDTASPMEMQSNTRYDISAVTVHSNPAFDMGPWRDFVLYHTSQAFLDELLDKLGDVIASSFPQLIPAMQAKAPGGHPRAGVRRFSDDSKNCEIALDCQVGMNSKVTGKATSVKSLHLDDSKELYAGLFYCRTPDDTSEGGDLLIYRRKPGMPLSFYDERFIRPERAEVAATVPYRANTFALLLNGLDAIHAVSPRSVTEHPRRLVNIIAEVYPTMPRLFDERPYAERAGPIGLLKSWFGKGQPAQY